VVRINGHTVAKSVLRQTGQLLIDIHGQSDHLSLLDKKNHLDFLDAYANTFDIRKRFADKVARLYEIGSELKSIESKEKDTIRQEEFLKYQIDEIIKAGLKEGEDEELEKERHIISFSENLGNILSKSTRSLYESESSLHSSSALAKLNEALQAMKKLSELDTSLKPHLDYLEKTVYGLEESARDIRHYADNLEYDPSRLEEIEIRLDLIRSLKRKYGGTIGDILVYLKKCRTELEGIESSSETRARMEENRAILKKELGQLADELSQKRLKAAQRLTDAVKNELHDLGMSRIQFQIPVSRTLNNEGLPGPDGKFYAFSSAGYDNVEFLASTNPGEPLKPLARIASTGEISRFTLALKSALSEADNIPVLIFDEVDIGVGGRSGDIIGKKLWFWPGVIR
jgi:DNA repair protein RecN (Recombination protein N)